MGLAPNSVVGFEKRRLVSAQGASGAQYDRQVEPYALWGRLVEIFCSSKLTKESDKMVAISGIARRFHPEIMDEYVAGLW